MSPVERARARLATFALPAAPAWAEVREPSGQAFLHRRFWAEVEHDRARRDDAKKRGRSFARAGGAR